MKYVILSAWLFFIISFNPAFSQVRWKAELGLNYSNVSAKDELGTKVDSDPVAGIYLAVGLNVPMGNQLFLEPSLVYSERGFKEEGDAKIGWGKDFKTQSSYIFLPVDLVYAIPVRTSSIRLGIGPYVGVGLGGRWKTSAPVLIGDVLIEDKGDVSFKNDNSARGDTENIYAKPWDYGLRIKVGYALYNQYMVSLLTQQGLADLQPMFGDYEPKSKIKNQAFALTFAYIF